MSSKRVPIARGGEPSIPVEVGATVGATVGVNLRWEDGTLVTREALVPEPPAEGLEVTYWRMVREIPANVVALAATTTTGLYVITGDGTSATRAIQPAAGETTVSNGDGVAGNPVVGLADVADSGSGALLAVTRDAKGRVSGTKSATITGTAGQIEVADGDAIAGLPTISLADVTPTPGGTLQRYGFDAKGRRIEEEAADTDDLAEGSANLYFTAARVRDTLLTGLSLASSAVISAADSALSAFGKLQAQITALASSVSGLVVQTITTGDTTHAPSGDAVFDALAGKGDLAGQNSWVGQQMFLSDINRDGAAGTGRNLIYRSSGAPRWSFGGNAVAESGSNSGTNFQIRRFLDDGSGSNVLLMERSSGNVTPGNDNQQRLGGAGLRWAEIFSANATINTSDAREKTAPRDLTETEIACAADLARLPNIFQWLHAIEEKGEGARLHCSPTVQSVIAAMEAHGLDPFRYGFVCYDEWDETPEVKDEETGEVTQEHRPAGDRYSLRPCELQFFIARGQEERLRRLEQALGL